MTQDAEAAGGRRRRWIVALAAASAWAAVVPYLGRGVGVRLDVPARVEVVDHVVPAAVVLGALLLLASGPQRGVASPDSLRWSLAAGATFLAGFWISSTHVPLVVEALDGVTAWDAALLHASSGIPVLVVGAVMLAIPLIGSTRRR